MNKKQSGFTLAEILITIGIMGILASITIPRFFPQAERAKTSEAVSILSAIRQGEEAYILDKGVYLEIPLGAADTEWAKIGMNNPNTQAVFFVYSVAWGASSTTFVATATRTAAGNAGANAGTTITMDQQGAFGGSHTFVPT